MLGLPLVPDLVKLTDDDLMLSLSIPPHQASRARTCIAAWRRATRAVRAGASTRLRGTNRRADADLVQPLSSHRRRVRCGRSCCGGACRRRPRPRCESKVGRVPACGGATPAVHAAAPPMPHGRPVPSATCDCRSNNFKEWKGKEWSKPDDNCKEWKGKEWSKPDDNSERGGGVTSAAAAAAAARLTLRRGPGSSAMLPVHGLAAAPAHRPCCCCPSGRVNLQLDALAVQREGRLRCSRTVQRAAVGGGNAGRAWQRNPVPCSMGPPAAR